MMRRLAVLAGIAILGGGVARAEGPGVKLGESLVLHPGLSVGGGYDSNVFYSSGTGSDSAPVGGGYLDVRPTLDLSTLSGQRGGETPHSLDFRLHLGGDLRFLMPTNPIFVGHNSYNADAGVAVAINPFGNYRLDLFANWMRLSQTPYSSSTAAASGNIDSDQAQAGLELRLRPGGQRLEITLRDVLTTYLFEDAGAGSLFTAKNDVMNDTQLRISWKFFPKTALYVAANFSPYFYTNTLGTTPPNAYPLHAVFGLIGLITPTLRVNANVGYGNSFTQSNPSYPNVSSYNNVVALFEGTWQPTLVTNLSLGYMHDFMQAFVGTYYTLDSPYVTLAQGIWRLTLLLRFSYEHRAYAGDLSRDGLLNGFMDNPLRTDNLLMGHAEIDLPIKDWLFIALGDDLQKNFSNCIFTGNGPLPVACTYFRNDVWLRLGVAY